MPPPTVGTWDESRAVPGAAVVVLSHELAGTTRFSVERGSGCTIGTGGLSVAPAAAFGADARAVGPVHAGPSAAASGCEMAKGLLSGKGTLSDTILGPIELGADDTSFLLRGVEAGGAAPGPPFGPPISPNNGS